MTATLDQYLGAHRELFDHFNGLCADLSDDAMGVQSLCPDWNVRDVITHTISVETMLIGWEPTLDGPPPFGKIGEFTNEVVGIDRDSFAEAISEVTTSRLADLEARDGAVVDAPSFTPSGPATYGRFLQVRVFDLWVHARDIAMPLGTTLDTGGFQTEAALQEVDDSIGYIVGKKIGLPDGTSIVFHVTGGVERDIAVSVEGRAGRVDSVASPDVEVTADVETFVMLAAGRIDPQERIDAGRITWSGDSEWGERAARNLAYTR